jgi:hypothetical protein
VHDLENHPQPLNTCKLLLVLLLLPCHSARRLGVATAESHNLERQLRDLLADKPSTKSYADKARQLLCELRRYVVKVGGVATAVGRVGFWVSPGCSRMPKHCLSCSTKLPKPTTGRRWAR